MDLYFNETEFAKRLVINGIEADLAKRMIFLQEQYQHCIGIIDKESVFQSPHLVHDFKRKHDVGPTMHIYDPGLLEQIFVSELKVSKELAHKFTECEDSYLKELGIM